MLLEQIQETRAHGSPLGMARGRASVRLAPQTTRSPRAHAQPRLLHVPPYPASHINASVKIPPLEGTGSSSMLSGGRSIVLPDAPPTPPPPSIANSFPNALPSALHRRFHQHPPTPLCLRWNPFGNTFVPPSPNYNSFLLRQNQRLQMGNCTSR